MKKKIITIPLRRWVLLMVSLSIASTANSSSDPDSDLDVALSIAEMLRAARTVVARYQSQINDPNVADKSLTGELILQDALNLVSDDASKQTGEQSRIQRYRQLQSEAIVEVFNENLPLINQKGVGFKGFVPAVFARLVNERFSIKAGGEALIKVTAPPDLIRNRKARPDKWELDIIESKFREKSWPTGTLYAENAQAKNRDAFRVMVPEYYGEACLACHGKAAGEVDITGYPKEGASAGQLAGAISIALFD